MNGHRSPRISMFTLFFVFVVCIMLGAESEMQISVEFGEVCAFRAWLKVPFSEMVKKYCARKKIIFVFLRLPMWCFLIILRLLYSGYRVGITRRSSTLREKHPNGTKTEFVKKVSSLIDIILKASAAN